MFYNINVKNLHKYICLYIYQYILVIKNKYCILDLIYIYLGETSLIVASYKGHLDVVRALVEGGADIQAKNNRGKLVYISYGLKFIL